MLLTTNFRDQDEYGQGIGGSGKKTQGKKTRPPPQHNFGDYLHMQGKQRRMCKESAHGDGCPKSQGQNFSNKLKHMQGRNKCAKTAPRKVALQCPSRTSGTTRNACRTECAKTAPRKVAFQREFWQMPEVLDA